MNRVKHFLQDGAGDGQGGGGGGGGGATITPADARTYLTGFGHGEDSLKGMPDPDVLKLHGAVTGHVGKMTEEAVKTASGKNWPSDWRQRFAGENADALKTLERFPEPAAMWKSYEAMRQKMASGELKNNVPFPEKGTAEEQGAWRKEHGIPDKPEAYDYSNLGTGVVIGDADKPMVTEYLKFAHGKNATPEAVKENLAWFFGPYREQQEAARAESTKAQMQQVEEQLRADWGTEYRPTMSAITGLLDATFSADSGIKDRILNSIKLEPEFAKGWASLALQLNPAGALTPGFGADAQKSIVDEYQAIQKKRTDNRAAYNKDEKMQARERELITAMQRMGVMDGNGNIVAKK